MTGGGDIYEEVATLYDSLVGEFAFENWLPNFLKLERAFSLDLRACADVACGTGKVLAYLAGRGARAYGVDGSEGMLSIAAERTRGMGVELFRQDMRGLCLPRQVTLVTCNTDSLNYLLEEDDLAGTLAGFWRALEPGGCAVFDMNTIRQLSSQEDRRIWKMREGDVRLYWRSGYDDETGIATLEMRHVVESPRGNRLYREVHRERGYALELIEELAERAGFIATYAWDAAGLGPVRRGHPPAAVPGPQGRPLNRGCAFVPCGEKRSS